MQKIGMAIAGIVLLLNTASAAECRYCQDTGMETVTLPCPVCRGSGRVKCTTCAGGTVRLPCPVCDGQGTFNSYDSGQWQVVQCTACSGTGYGLCPACRGIRTVTCTVCFGTGKWNMLQYCMKCPCGRAMQAAHMEDKAAIGPEHLDKLIRYLDSAAKFQKNQLDMDARQAISEAKAAYYRDTGLLYDTYKPTIGTPLREKYDQTTKTIARWERPGQE